MRVPVAPQFYATDAGRQHFANQLTSIRYCVQETCNFDVLYAYLVSASLGLKRVSRSRPTPPFASQTCGNYDFNYDKSKNLRAPRRPTPRALRVAERRSSCTGPRRNIRASMQHEVMLYAIAQKEGLGLDKAVEECAAAPRPVHREKRVPPLCTNARRSPSAGASTACRATGSRPT